MKKYIICLVTLCTLWGCKDNSGLYGLLTDYDSRIAALEQLCSEMNTNISSLQAIVEVLQSGDYVTSVTPITSGGTEVGYTITFANHEPITIYHGKDGANGQDGKDGTNGTNGQDGHTPVIGVAQDTDGVYYWTLDGEWLLDGNGNKLRVTGQDGKDGKDGKDGEDGTNGTNGTNGANGITPQLKIETDYWWISYDNGTTWTQLGKAKGDKGDKGEDGTNGTNGQDGDSMFQSVTQDDNNVYFTLTNGTIITLSKGNGLSNGLPKENGHCYVDLGLPSGTMWAACNLGGEFFGDYGDYYAFGVTTPNSEEAPTAFIVNGVTLGNSGGSIAGSEYDAARANWGGKWQMPTITEWSELTNNCTYHHTTAINCYGIGVDGVLLTSKTNKKQLFLILDEIPTYKYGNGTTTSYDYYGKYLTANLYQYSSPDSYAYQSYVIHFAENYGTSSGSTGVQEYYQYQVWRSDQNALQMPKFQMVRPIFHP